MNGLIAASLAAEGFRGSAAAIEGRHGLLAGYTDAPRPERAVQGLGRDWETLRIAVKPYPSCRYSHAALDGLLELRRRHGLTGGDVRALEVGLHRSGVVLVGEPEAAKRRPRNVVDGQFSMAFCAAVALDQGGFGWDDYRRLGDSAIDALCDKITVVRDEAVEAASPHPFGARVSLRTAKGDFELSVRDPSGEPGSFPDRAALEAKFLALAEPVLGEGARRLADRVLALERFGQVGEALAPRRPAGRRRSAA
jgi:2-methylcitrate dehydratase PrpD